MPTGPLPIPTAFDRRTVAFGRACYGLGVAGLGVQFFVNQAFVAVILPKTPAPPYWTAVGGMALILIGLTIAAGWKGRRPAVALTVAFLAAFLCGHVPVQLPAWRVLGLWTAALKCLALAGGAAIAATTFPPVGALDPALRRAGSVALGLMLFVFGIDHFLYLDFVAGLVPSWIPGHVFWARFAGVALIAGGLGLLLGLRARLAALLSGVMIFAWLIVLHLPRAVADPHSLQGNEISSVFEALAFSGLGFILWRTLPLRAKRE